MLELFKGVDEISDADSFHFDLFFCSSLLVLVERED